MAVENDQERQKKLNEQLWKYLNDEKKVLELLNQGADPNFTLPDDALITFGAMLWPKWSMLACAVYKGYTESVRILLSKGARADQVLLDNPTGYKGWSLLAYSIYKSYDLIAKALLQYGADPNQKIPSFAKNPSVPIFQFAIENKYVEIAADLIRHGAYPENPWPQEELLGSSWLEFAKNNGFVPVVEAIASYRNGDGRTTLHIAVLNDDTNYISTLLGEKQVDVNAKDKRKQSPLHMATLAEKFDCVQMLAGSERVDRDIQDEEGNTPLHLAINGNLIGITQILILTGADLTLENKQYLVPYKLILEKIENKVIDGKLLFNMEVINFLRRRSNFTGQIGRISQHFLGLCYKNGWNIEQDETIAAKWFARADEDEISRVVVKELKEKNIKLENRINDLNEEVARLKIIQQENSHSNTISTEARKKMIPTIELSRSIQYTKPPYLTKTEDGSSASLGEQKTNIIL